MESFVIIVFIIAVVLGIYDFFGGDRGRYEEHRRLPDYDEVDRD